MSSTGMPTVRRTDDPRWEYYLIQIDAGGLFGPHIDVETIGENLNSAGEEKWELVTVIDINRGHGVTDQLLAILKRPIR